MSAFVYILRCADGRLYYGSSRDLRRRLHDHQRGHVRTTKVRRPVELVYLEQVASDDEARQRERALKNGRTRRATIERMIATFPRERLADFHVDVSRAGAS